MVYQGAMDQAAATRPMPMSLPNVLTYGRILAVPGLVACLFFLQGDVARWSAFALFVLAGVTDWLDGYLARIWEQQSNLGRMLDTIADKLLVGATLLMLVYSGTIGGWSAAEIADYLDLLRSRERVMAVGRHQGLWILIRPRVPLRTASCGVSSRTAACKIAIRPPLCVKVNTDEFPDAKKQFGIKSWPTDLILAPDGRVMEIEDAWPKVND
mgnify:CR=1 FL=1